MRSQKDQRCDRVDVELLRVLPFVHLLLEPRPRVRVLRVRALAVLPTQRIRASLALAERKRCPRCLVFQANQARFESLEVSLLARALLFEGRELGLLVGLMVVALKVQQAVDDQMGSQFDFSRFWDVPGVPSGVLVVPLGALGPALGRPWRLKKKASGACCIPESILRVKRDAPGHAVAISSLFHNFVVTQSLFNRYSFVIQSLSS